jgi:hypothetical protein
MTSISIYNNNSFFTKPRDHIDFDHVLVELSGNLSGRSSDVASVSATEASGTNTNLAKLDEADSTPLPPNCFFKAMDLGDSGKAASFVQLFLTPVDVSPASATVDKLAINAAARRFAKP